MKIIRSAFKGLWFVTKGVVKGTAGFLIKRQREKRLVKEVGEEVRKVDTADKLKNAYKKKKITKEEYLNAKKILKKA